MKNDRFGPYMYSIIETSECLKKEAKWKKKLSRKSTTIPTCLPK